MVGVHTTLRGLLGLALLVTLGGCVPLPIPHVHQQTPEVRGHLHRGGVPLADVQVTRRAEWSSETLRDGGRTDEEGRFVLSGRREFHPGRLFWLAGAAPHAYTWEICFGAPGGDLCWKDAVYTQGQAPRSVRLECDLERVALAQGRAGEGATRAERRGDVACRAGGARDDR